MDLRYIIGGILMVMQGMAGPASGHAGFANGPGNTNEERYRQRDTIFEADPTIFYDNGVYYLYGTHTTDKGFEVYTSTDLRNWEKERSPALSKKEAFGENGFWAPQVFKDKNKYYMAYTADEHIAIAESDSPLGPFKQQAREPLIKTGKTIDPFVFIDGRRKYLYYVKLQQGNRLFVAELKDDFSGIKPRTERPCINAADHPQPWENTDHREWTVTEGPAVLKHDGRYYLFYSANDFRNPDYAVGYAISESPLGPWKKNGGNPILDKRLTGENGPGHGDFFKDENGHFFYVFHTHFSGNRVAPRRTALIRWRFVSEGNADQIVFDQSSFRYLYSK